MDDVPTIVKNFNTVNCGQRKTDYFKLENPTDVTKKFKIVRSDIDATPEVSHDRLNIIPRTIVAVPEKTVRIKLIYQCYLDNITDNFVYDIYDSENLVAHLNVHAQTVGPKILVNSTQFKFFNFAEHALLVKPIAFTNKTNCETRYHFEIDENYVVFKISQKEGTIRGNGKEHIELAFNPPGPGIFYKQIFCLIQYHNPVLITLVGFSNPKASLPAHPDNLNYTYAVELNYATSSYKIFMDRLHPKIVEEEARLFTGCNSKLLDEDKDVSSNISPWKSSKSNSQNIPVNYVQTVFLTNYYLDIENMSKLPKATTLINMSSSDLFLYMWELGNQNNFSVQPSSGTIGPCEKVEFTLFFSPTNINLFYHADLEIKIYKQFNSDTDFFKNIYVPYSLTIRVIGNAFPDDSCGWMPLANVVPTYLQLPACVPGETVYGTLCIERSGHLPVTFKTVLRKDSNYTIQPPLGFIFREYQILIIQFDNSDKEKGLYKEDLKIIYNNLEKNCDNVKLETSVEIPVLFFDENNSIFFSPTFPGSEVTGVITIKNPTNLYLRYKFIVPEDINWIEFPNPQGTVEPKSESTTEAVFKPKYPCEYFDYVSCDICSIFQNDFINTVNVQINGSSQYGYLVAIPSTYDFGECIYKKKKTVRIHMFNFSPVCFNFRLTAQCNSIPEGDPEADVSFKSRDYITGRGSLSLDVTITANGTDVFCYKIMCEIMKNGSEDAPSCDQPRLIFSLTFQGVLPSIKVIDINTDYCSPLFSPHWLWKMMCINKVNKAMKLLTPEQKIEVKYPELMINTGPITITLLLEAAKYGDIGWGLQKRTVCQCFKNPDWSIKQTKDCLHKNTTYTLSRHKLGAGERMQLNLTIPYEDFDECAIEWTFSLPFDRKVIISGLVVTLPDEDPTFVSVFMPSIFEMKPVFLGDPQPPVQVYWMYNNTHLLASYIVDKINLKKSVDCLNNIFDCLNPNGVIPPYSMTPLCFVFKPVELKLYVAKVHICLKQHKLTSITLIGEGVHSVEQITEFSIERTIPEHPILYDESIQVECSISIINIIYVQTFSVTRRIFMLYNKSDTDVWAFQWHSFRAEKLIEATISPSTGVLLPKEKMAMTLTIRSFFYPSYLSFSIPCDVICYTKLKDFETALKFQDIVAENSKEFFTINDSGTFHEPPDISMPEKPEPAHIFISVNINIFSCLQLDYKLKVRQQLSLATIDDVKSEIWNEPLILKKGSVQILLEKIIWNILDSPLIVEKLRTFKDPLDYCYIQILPDEPAKSHKVLELPLKVIQNIIEHEIQDVVCRYYVKAETQ